MTFNWKTAGVLLAAAFIVIAAILAGRYAADNRMPCFTKDYVLYVYPDTDAMTAIDSLMDGAGALRRGSLERCARKEGLEEGIRPGRYVIEPSFTAVYAVRMMVHGWQTPQNMTLSGTIRTKDRHHLHSYLRSQTGLCPDGSWLADSPEYDSLRYHQDKGPPSSAFLSSQPDGPLS